MYHDIGVCGHNLLLGSKLGALLELEVADRSGQSEVAIHPSKINETTGGGDSCLLACGPPKRSASHVHLWRSALGGSRV